MSLFPPRALPWLRLIRLPATFSAWSNVIAAHWIATGGEPRLGLLGLQLGIATALYWSGMVLNDCFDLAEDSRERPGRPIPSGVIAPARAWALGWSLMGLAVVLGILAGGATLVATLLLALAVLLYDGVLKSGPLGPVAMGACRWLNWVMGLSAAPLTAASIWLPLPVFLYTAGVTVLSRGETMGAERGSVRIATLLLLCALAVIPMLYLAGLLSSPFAILGAGLAALALAARMRRVAQDGSALTIRSQVRSLLLAMVALDALLLLGAGHQIAALALLILMVPGPLLGRGLYMT